MQFLKYFKMAFLSSMFDCLDLIYHLIVMFMMFVFTMVMFLYWHQ